MSRRAVEWVSRQKPPHSSDKLVLWAIADAASDRTLTAYPSAAAIAEFTGLERKRILAGLARLQSLGLLVDTGKRCGRTNQIKIWQVPVEQSPIGDA